MKALIKFFLLWRRKKQLKKAYEILSDPTFLSKVAYQAELTSEEEEAIRDAASVHLLLFEQKISIAVLRKDLKHFDRIMLEV